MESMQESDELENDKLLNLILEKRNLSTSYLYIDDKFSTKQTEIRTFFKHQLSVESCIEQIEWELIINPIGKGNNEDHISVTLKLISRAIVNANIEMRLLNTTGNIISEKNVNMKFSNVYGECLGWNCQLSIFVEKNYDMIYCLRYLVLLTNVNVSNLKMAQPTTDTDQSEEIQAPDFGERLLIELNEDTLTDVVFDLQGEQLRAHKFMLASASQVFKNMFAGTDDGQEDNKGVIRIDDVAVKTMKSLLQYIYTNEILCEDDLKELVVVGVKFELPKLVTVCEDRLMAAIDPSNVVELIMLADQNSTMRLKHACINMVKMFSKTVTKSENWTELCDTNPQLAIEIMEKAL